MLRKEEILRQCKDWAKEASTTFNNACIVGLYGLGHDMESLASGIQTQYNQIEADQAVTKKARGVI